MRSYIVINYTEILSKIGRNLIEIKQKKHVACETNQTIANNKYRNPMEWNDMIFWGAQSSGLGKWNPITDIGKH